MIKEFVCVAEAVAHYYTQGFCTVHEGGDHRVMQREQDFVTIRHLGWFQVEARLELNV